KGQGRPSQPALVFTCSPEAPRVKRKAEVTPGPTMFSKRSKSHAAFAKACTVIPGGVNSPARAFGGVGGQPIFIARGEGPFLVDVDGNRYLDYVGSWGTLILGHAHPRVVRAVEEALRRGTSFGAPCEAETELAKTLTQ